LGFGRRRLVLRLFAFKGRELEAPKVWDAATGVAAATGLRVEGLGA
jgi:hypothetical protein